MPAPSQNAPLSPPAPPRRRRPIRLVWVGLLSLVALAVVAYFVLSSQAFLKAVVLPRVGSAMNARITADRVELSPFSRLHLTQVRVETTGDQPLLQADALTVRYRLASLVRGKIAVPEITVVRPLVNVVVAPDGKSNLDPLLEEGEPEPPARKSETVDLDIGSIRVQSGALAYCQLTAGGGRDCASITNLDLSITDLRNDAAGKLTVSAGIVQSQTAPGAPPETARGQLSGNFNFYLQPDLMPREAQGDLKLEFTQAEGALKELAGWSGALAVDLAPDELRQLSLKFVRQGQPLGEARFRGPLNLPRRSGRVDFTITSIGRTALNLFGAPLGLDFGDTAIEGSGFCDVAGDGRKITANVTLAARNFSVTQGGMTTPPLDLRLEMRGNTDLRENSAYLDKLSARAIQAGQPLVALEVQRALNLTWKVGELPASAPGDVLFTVNDLRLADWRSVLGTNLQGGIVNVRAGITSSQAGRQIKADFTNTVTGLTFQAGDTLLRDVNTEFSGTLSVGDFRTVGLERGIITYGEGPGTNKLVRGTLTANFDPRTSSGNLQFAGDGSLAELLKSHPVPNLAFDRGNLRTTLLVNFGQDQVSGTASLLAGDVNGTVGGYRLSGYSAQLESAGEMQRDKLVVRQLALSAREGTRSGGTADLVGELDGATQTAQFTVNMTGLNQAALRPFLAPWLTDHDLTSLTINARGDLRFDAGRVAPPSLDYYPRIEMLLTNLAAGAGETSFRLNANATNLVMTRRATKKASPPTGFGVVLDATRRGDVYKLGTNRMELPATPRAQNQLVVGGQLDLSATNASPSVLTARAASLELTDLYDLMMLMSETSGNAASTTPSAPAPPPAPEVEPEPISLPIQKLAADLKVDSLYLREIVVSNWTAQATVDHGKISIAPVSLTMNDAPVTAQAHVDVTRPGYLYDLGMTASAIPLEPLVNSTAPEYAGKIRGDVFARMQIAGAGITGPNLQKHLQGQVHFHCTNLNFEIVTPRTKKLLTTLATAFRLEDLARSPLNLLAADLVITNGSIQVQPFVAASDAFHATAAGAITLAPVLTNSTVNVPVQLALRQDLARQIKLANLTPSPRTNYLALPQIVRLAGTLGAPETEIDKVRLAALVAGSLGGAIGGQTGTALEGVNSLLQGNTQGAVGALNNLLQKPKGSGSTNAVEGVNSLIQGTTNIQGALGTLNSLLQKPKPAAATNASLTNAPAVPSPGTTNAPKQK